MVRQLALRKLGGNMLVSPGEPTLSACVEEYPVMREFPDRPSAPGVEPEGTQGVAAERVAGPGWVPAARSAETVEPRRVAELLALAARAAWARGDAGALTRTGRRLFRLAGSTAGLPVVEPVGAAGNAGATQALARQVLALGDLAAGRLPAPPAALTLPWAEDPALWLPPRLIPELLGDDFGTYRSCATLLERLRAAGAGERLGDRPARWAATGPG